MSGTGPQWYLGRSVCLLAREQEAAPAAAGLSKSAQNTGLDYQTDRRTVLVLRGSGNAYVLSVVKTAPYLLQRRGTWLAMLTCYVSTGNTTCRHCGRQRLDCGSIQSRLHRCLFTCKQGHACPSLAHALAQISKKGLFPSNYLCFIYLLFPNSYLCFIFMP